MKKILTAVVIAMFALGLASCAPPPVKKEPPKKEITVEEDIVFYGEGQSALEQKPGHNAAQAKAMAKRAALMDAYRNLMERIQGVYIDSQTTVKDFVAQSDDIKAKMESYINNAEVIDEQDNGDGTFTAKVKVTKKQLVTFVEDVKKK